MNQMRFRRDVINTLGELNLPDIFENMIRATDCQVGDGDNFHPDLLLACSQFCEALASLTASVHFKLLALQEMGCPRCYRLTEHGRCPHCLETINRDVKTDTN